MLHYKFIKYVRDKKIKYKYSVTHTNFKFWIRYRSCLSGLQSSSVADPDPPDPHVFGPPGSGSGSISQRYGPVSGSGSFYHQAKKVRKTLIPTAL
jgi:hypothetical protein